MSISLSKWPMLHTIALCFIRSMWSTVMMSSLPVARHEDVGGADDVLERQ